MWDPRLAVGLADCLSLISNVAGNGSDTTKVMLKKLKEQLANQCLSLLSLLREKAKRTRRKKTTARS